MIKSIIAIIACVSLSGCFYQSVDSYDLSRATKICGSIDNIVRINSHFLGFENVRCYDTHGSSIDLGSVQGGRK